MLPEGWAESALYYVTTGRRTGRPHEVEIWCVAVGEALYLMAGSGLASDTVRNALASPAVTVRVGSETRPAVASLVGDPAEDAAVRAAMLAKYETSPGSLAGWGATALPLRLDVGGGDSAGPG
jgi:deazaflavin-dependent oxidoreductase (nitroreductase family)